MQVISSSQSQDQAAATNSANPKNNQQPSTAFTRAVSAANEHVSKCEQPVGGAVMPSDTGLVDRTITETQALSVHSEPLTAAFQLPAGHTYQPYFWLSPLAHRLMAPPPPWEKALEEEMQSKVIGQLLMSEKEAEQDFQAHFEYRFVDYGFTSNTASGVPEKNYGIFARKPIAKGTLLGIYSGIGYLLKTLPLDKFSSIWGWSKPERIENLHRKYTEEMPDFMNWYRSLVAGVRGKEQTQRTPTKYCLGEPAVNPSNYIGIMPNDERYTPMHFINSANEPEDVNADFDLITVNTGSGKFHIPICVAIRGIAAGQEVLLSYCVKPDAKVRWGTPLNGADEKLNFDRTLSNYLTLIKELNCAAPDKPPISPYVAAPAICISEIIRETFCGKVAETYQPPEKKSRR